MAILMPRGLTQMPKAKPKSAKPGFFETLFTGVAKAAPGVAQAEMARRQAENERKRAQALAAGMPAPAPIMMLPAAKPFPIGIVAAIGGAILLGLIFMGTRKK